MVFPPQGAPQLEGSFTSWAQLYSFLSAFTFQEPNVYVDEAGGFVLIHDSDVATRTIHTIKLADGTFTQNVGITAGNAMGPDAWNANPQEKVASVLNKYFALVDKSTTPKTLRIYKGGAVLFSLALPAAFNASLQTWAYMSPSGKYVVVLANANANVFVAVGS